MLPPQPIRASPQSLHQARLAHAPPWGSLGSSIAGLAVNLTEYSWEREGVCLTHRAAQGDRTAVRAEITPVVPGSAGRRVGGEHPQQRASCCPSPSPGRPCCRPPVCVLFRPRGVRGRPSAQAWGLRQLGVNTDKDTCRTARFCSGRYTLPWTTVFLQTWAASTAMRQVIFPHVHTKGELGTHFLLVILEKMRLPFEFSKNSSRKPLEDLRRLAPRPH